MKLEWLILAEGVAQDADGALTAVGLNQNILISSILPTVTKRAIIAHLSGLQPGEELSFRFRVESPSGEVIAANAGRANLDGIPPWADQGVEATFDIPAELQLEVRELGKHRFVVSMDSSTGQHAEADVPLYVIKQPQQGRPDKGGS
ncbi:hypothetical protein [Actinomadura roseirufa]|uniref:hypothetical protein n=1 Tax=Actinomadura roseirufa TaxID=2094049 RepID=UPI001041A1BE|nr:hypothetical protein [Actinomadura roseirufa]